MTVLTPGCGPNAPIVAGKDARAGTYQTTASGKLLHSFTLHNTSTTATTRAAARLGLAFLKGDVPKGKKLAVWVKGGRRVPFSAAAATNSWADGSLRSTADGGMVMLDGSLGPGQSRTYEVHVVNGTAPASGFDPFAWLAAHGNDLTVAVTGRTGSATGAKPDLLFSLKTALATTTRREILCDTDRFVRIKAWQKVPQEEHLICEYHLDFWLDEAGQPFGLEFAPVLSQHWWVADPFGQTQTKERYTYDAVVRYGTTVLDSRTRLDHAYYCRWASLRPQDDAQHARKHWIGLGLSQMPTVRVQYDDESLKRMMKAGYVPPLRLSASYAAPATVTCVPLGTNGHRASIAAGGAYAGRGMWSNFDAKLVVQQGSAPVATAELAWRGSRVAAQAGLANYTHACDHRSATGVNGDIDTTNRIIPGYFRRRVGASYAGLATPCVYAQGAANAFPSGVTVLAHSGPTGGTGSFSSYDNAHACNYSGAMAFLEGEAYLGDATVSAFMKSAYYLNYNQYGHDKTIEYANSVRGTATGVPSGATGTNQYGQMWTWLEERGRAWPINLLNHAYMIRAGSHPDQGYLADMIKNTDALLSKSFDYYPVAHRNKGCAFPNIGGQGGTQSLWMLNWQGMFAYQATRLYDFLPDNDRAMNGFEEMAHLAARYVVKGIAANPYWAASYRTLWNSDGNTAVTPLPDDEWPTLYSGTFASNVVTAAPPTGLTWSNGDKFRFPFYNTSYQAQTAPSGITAGALYYLVNVSGPTFHLAATEDGEPISFGDLAARSIAVTPQAQVAIRVADPIGSYGAVTNDTYMPIAFALFEQAIGESHADMTPGIRDSARSFYAPVAAAHDSWATWNYDGDCLK